MIGITSYGVYIPLWRLDLAAIGGGRGERAIANFDEDSLTMGVAAGINCLGDMDRSTIDGLFFATTTSPYKEKQISTTAAAALDLREGILTADFANSLRAGTAAFRAAIDAVKAGSAKRIMVVAADMRLAMAGSEFERLFGNGAVALLIGTENVKVSIKDSHSISDEILDIWRTDEDRFVRSWEARFTMDEGYLRVLPIAVQALMEKNNLTPSDLDHAIFYAPDSRRHKEMAGKLGFAPTQVQEPMFGSLGDTGAAFALTLLAASFENVKPSDKMLLASYGNGADVFLLEVMGEFEEERGVKSFLESKRILKDYKTYLRWRELLEMVTGRRRPPIPTPSASVMWRERAQNIRLHGVKCKKCGMVQYPPQRICAGCHAKDQFESYRFSDKRAELFTYTTDYLTPTPDPPLVLAVVDFDGGGRIWVNITDKDEGELEIGMPLKMTFRRLFTADGIHDYFWKCAPVRFR